MYKAKHAGLFAYFEVLRSLPACGTSDYRGGGALCGYLSKGSFPVFRRVSEKAMENFERLGRKAQPEFECGTFRLSVLSAEPLHCWWGPGIILN